MDFSDRLEKVGEALEGTAAGCQAIIDAFKKNGGPHRGSKFYFRDGSIVRTTIESGVMDARYAGNTELIRADLGSEVTAFVAPSGEEARGAFEDCTRLTAVSFDSEVVKDLGRATFNRCETLQHVSEIPSAVTRIGRGVFGGTPALTAFRADLPSGCRVVEVGAFSDSGLTAVTLNDGLTVIGEEALARCHNLTSISIPNSVVSCGARICFDCEGLISAHVGNGLTYGDDEGETAGYGHFASCSKLRDVDFEDGATDVLLEMFLGCDSLSGVTLPSSVSAIQEHGFDGCSSLTSYNAVVPDSVVKIEEQAFAWTGLKGNILFSPNVAYVGTNAFENVTEPVKLYANLNITTGLTLAEAAFRNIPGLTDAALWVEDVPNYCFYADTALSSVDLGPAQSSKVKTIGDAAFWGCNALSSIEIPDSVERISVNAFVGTRINSVRLWGRTVAEAPTMTNYPWSLNNGCVVHCDDGDIFVS